MTMTKQLRGSHLFLIVVALALTCASLATADDGENGQSSSEEVQRLANKDKRPFCNAFAGCGRKRASLVKEMQNIALARALPAYAYYSKSDLKLLQELFAKYRQQHERTDSSSEEDEHSNH